MSKHQQARNIAAGLTKGMINAYICKSLHTIVTKNVDDGFVPAKIACPSCDKEANSMMYQVDQELSPQVEWFRPSEAEVQAAILGMKPAQAESYRKWVNSGGLISREYKLPNLQG